jgi:predicted transglutaminase-like cysteine proteinase
MFKKIIAAASLVIAASLLSTTAEARSHVLHFKKHHSVKMAARHGGGVMPPFAYIQFCVHHASACRDTKGSLAMASSNSVRLNAKLQRQLASVNSRVNNRMKPKADGGADKWAVGGKSGDCEDFAMTKRAMLIAAGWPSRALSMTVVRTAWGEGHAVLSVRTSAGTMVLDNLSRAVRPLSHVPYKVIAMQGGSALQWNRRSEL